MNIFARLSKYTIDRIEDSDNSTDFFESITLLFGLATVGVGLTSIIVMAIAIFSERGLSFFLGLPVFLTFLPWAILLWTGILSILLHYLIAYATYEKVHLFKQDDKNNLQVEPMLNTLLGLWMVYAVSAIVFWLFVWIPSIMIWSIVLIGGGTAIVKLSRKIFMVYDRFEQHKTDPNAHSNTKEKE